MHILLTLSMSLVSGTLGIENAIGLEDVCPEPEAATDALLQREHQRETTMLEAQEEASANHSRSFHAVMYSPFTCQCSTPGRAAPDNGYTCTNGVSGHCKPDEECYQSGRPFRWGDWACGCRKRGSDRRCEFCKTPGADFPPKEYSDVTCKCSTPGRSAPGNGFTCTNGDSRHCAHDQVCYQSDGIPFRWGDWQCGCRQHESENPCRVHPTLGAFPSNKLYWSGTNPEFSCAEGEECYTNVAFDHGVARQCGCRTPNTTSACGKFDQPQPQVPSDLMLKYFHGKNPQSVIALALHQIKTDSFQSDMDFVVALSKQPDTVRNVLQSSTMMQNWSHWRLNWHDKYQPVYAAPCVCSLELWLSSLEVEPFLYRGIEWRQNQGDWAWNESCLEEAFKESSEKLADLIIWGAMRLAYASGASTVPPPPPPERPIFYLDQGYGKCQDSGGNTPRWEFIEDVHEGFLAEKCRENPECGGYSWSYSAHGGFLWLESPLSGGGASWGEVKCMILGERNMGKNEEQKGPEGEPFPVWYESQGEGECLTPDSKIAYNRKLQDSGSEKDIAELCTSNPNCGGYFGHWIYLDRDLKGGGQVQGGLKCMLKRIEPSPPTPSPMEQYTSLGEGKCLTWSGGDPPQKYYRSGSPKFLAQKCNDIPDCGGFTHSRRGGGILWLESRLKGEEKTNGKWRSCMVKQSATPPPTPSPLEQYTSLGKGRCRTASGDAPPQKKYYNFPSRKFIAQKCNDNPDCGGFSYDSRRGIAILWLESPLKGGGWGDCSCMVKQSATIPPTTTTPSPLEQYTSLGEGVCLTSSGGDPPKKFIPGASAKLTAQKCNERLDCGGFSHGRVGGVLWLASGLKGGGRGEGISCMVKQ